jgi:hypothetical protein
MLESLSICDLGIMTWKLMSFNIRRLLDETISNLKTNSKNLRTNKENFPGAAIAEIVFLLDEDSGICNRFETKLFGAILQGKNSHFGQR